MKSGESFSNRTYLVKYSCMSAEIIIFKFPQSAGTSEVRCVGRDPRIAKATKPRVIGNVLVNSTLNLCRGGGTEVWRDNFPHIGAERSW